MTKRGDNEHSKDFDENYVLEHNNIRSKHPFKITK